MWDRLLPLSIRPYLRLARVDRPIGTWLLLLPCWWGQLFVCLQYEQVPHVWYAFLFAVGALVMRAAGCTINDILDKDLDAHVERTRNRPLPSGQISVRQAYIFLLGLLSVGFLILLQFNLLTIVLGVVSLILVFCYPLMKRITWWPQVFLGVTFNWGVLLGATSETAKLDLPILLLYLGSIFWTVGYDTLYAHQDKVDDAKIGIKSTARLWGKYSRIGVCGCYSICLGLWLSAALVADLGAVPGFYYGLFVSMILLLQQILHWVPDVPESCLRQFRFNQWVGWALLGGLGTEILFA